MVIFPKTEHRIFNTAFPDILVFIGILKVLQTNEKKYFPTVKNYQVQNY